MKYEILPVSENYFSNEVTKYTLINKDNGMRIDIIPENLFKYLKEITDLIEEKECNERHIK